MCAIVQGHRRSQRMFVGKNHVLSTGFLFVMFVVTRVSAQNNSTHFLDRFTYDETTRRGDGFVDYQPSLWGKIECDETSAESLEQCEGYPHKWHEGINWTVTQNYCRWCPLDAPLELCGRHHQSPINLLREVGLDLNTSDAAKECIVSRVHCILHCSPVTESCATVGLRNPVL